GKDVYADFQNVPPPPQILTVKVVPADKGNKVNSDDGGISNCTNSCTHSYPKGTTITLTATADPGYDYGNWSGGGCSGSDSSPCTVSMDAAKTVTADFTPKSSTPNGVRTLGTCNSPPYWGGFQACAEANPNGNQTFGWFDWKLNYGDLDASSTPSCYPVDLGNGTTTVGIAPYAGIGAACDGSCKYNPGWGYPGCPGPGTPIYYRFHVCYRPYCPSSIDSQSNQTDPSKDIKGYTQFVSTGPGVDVKQDACEIWNDSNDGSKVHLQSMTCHHDGQADTWPQEIRYRFYTCTPDGSGWYTSGSTGKVTNPNGNTGVDIPILAGSFHDLQLEAWSAGMSGTNWVDSAFNHCP
ncbi:MAG TPA: hypothetical protein VFB03_03805, partial [Candidatus Saccharimonadales bacterium]|nr:hypothetical protein [Candidatus Saccharimonadales bacterium]